MKEEVAAETVPAAAAEPRREPGRELTELTSTSAGVSLQFRTSMTVMTSRVASSRRRRRTRTSSSVISGPGHSHSGKVGTRAEDPATPIPALNPRFKQAPMHQRWPAPGSGSAKLLVT